jgi:hypothetical protein
MRRGRAAVEPEVKSAGANIQASTVSTIVLGFAADPMARWVWPYSSEYLRIMPQFVNAFGGRAFEHGTAYITEEARAAALWLPPGVEPDEAAMGAVTAQESYAGNSEGPDDAFSRSQPASDFR